LFWKIYVPLSIETVPKAEHVDCAAAEAGSPTKAQQIASAIANIGKVDRFFTNNVSFAVTFICVCPLHSRNAFERLTLALYIRYLDRE
jgi:hypothetical protein